MRARRQAQVSDGSGRADVQVPAGDSDNQCSAGHQQPQLTRGPKPDFDKLVAARDFAAFLYQTHVTPATRKVFEHLDNEVERAERARASLDRAREVAARRKRAS